MSPAYMRRIPPFSKRQAIVSFEAKEPSARKPRADGQRNRERLAEAAKAAFAVAGPDVSLDGIARRAGVGVGTLYPHFPTRDALLRPALRRPVLSTAQRA